MGRAPQLAESARLTAGVHGINNGGRDIFPVRCRRVSRRQTADDSETYFAWTVNRAHHYRRPLWACLCAAVGKSLLAGALLGGIGGIVGAFVGYSVRRRLLNNF